MSQTIKNIAIVGGGTAGWLTAAIIASHHKQRDFNDFKITLIESSDIPTVGVGEGTWPTLKNTIRSIGLKEKDIFKHCFAGFKQGGKFVNWVRGDGDFYYHPFTVPLGYGRIDLAPYVNDIENYAVESNFQHHVCEAGLAPRGITEGEFQGQCNYAYHLDAGAFAELLKKHCRIELGVEHVVATVLDAKLDTADNISSLLLEKEGSQESFEADLFVDCTGFRSLLLGKKMDVPFISTDDILFNDSALAMHVPYVSEDDPVACHTIATGQNAGWTWDIGLTARRGVGHVYSSQYLTDEQGKVLSRVRLVSSLAIESSSGRIIVWRLECRLVLLSH